MYDQIFDLYHSLEEVLPGSHKKIIQFISSRSNEGTSTVVRDFAKTLTSQLGKSVLILDADWKNPSQHLSFGIKPDLGWGDTMVGGKSIDSALYQVDDSSLFVSPFFTQATSFQNIFELPLIAQVFEQLKQRFDFVLIDSPAGTLAPEVICLASKVDGTVLVLEAEKTRWPVAEDVKNKITKRGGRILGVILNKRRYYLPDFIYNLL